MKKTHLLSLALACMLSVSQAMFGQKVTRDEWRKQIQAQETTINDYVEKKLRGSNQEGLLKEFYASVDHGDEIKKADLPKMLDEYLKNHYRLKYFEENPGKVALYNPGRIDLQAEKSSAAAPAPVRSVACFNGDFESDPTLANYVGYRGPMYTGNECTFVPATAVAYTPISLGSPNEFLLTNNVPDPMIPGLNQTNNGSAHAMRINGPGPCTPNRGINMLQRSFTTPTAGAYQISFSYALVMENPKGHGNAQPFFVARVLDGAGVEVGSRICRISDLTNPIYNITGYRPNPTGCTTTDSLVWRDWTCASIQFQGDPSQTYTIEFFAADCAAGAHFGYAYVDDICASECCPKFFMRDCCDMHGGSSSGHTAAGRSSENSIVQQVLADYNQRMAVKYNLGAANRSASAAAAPDPCCNPCAYPNDPYPVFIMDEFNNLISSTDYVISWSHDPGNTSAYAFLLPNQQTIITVKGPGNCVWTDTLKLNCCSDTIKITPFCTWDPCQFPNSPYAVRVLDQNGNTLTSAGGYTFQWFYTTGTSTGDAITATVANYPIIVKVKYPNGCEYTDTLKINCCKANTPINLKCSQVTTGSLLTWDPVPGATYKLIITTFDPACCAQGMGASYVINIATTSTVIPTSFASCFSWQVISVCPDGTESRASAKLCSCSPPSCNPKVPDNLKCSPVTNGSLISWNPVPGTTYKVIINANDPACCHTGIPPTSMTFTIAATSTVIPTSLVGCFSWQVISVCPSGIQSGASAKACSCSPPPCVANTPENLKCTQVTSGSQITWDPVPGATYKVVINVNDPACCPQGQPQSTITWNVASTGTIVPTSVANCFSWYVIAICPDGSQSQASGKKCSCSPVTCIPKVPDNLKCNQVSNGSQISWNPVPGATYQVIITTNDPACCHTNQLGFSMVWNVATTNTIVPTSVAGCFSWYVIAICPDGSRSAASVKMCSCSPQVSCIPKTPINLKCFSNLSGSNISWDPVPGATYKVIITTYDPACCRNSGQLGMSIVWNVAGTSTVVPTSLASCFSWYVIAICPDGSQSPASVKVCSCSPIITPFCADPNSLRCAVVQNQTRLTWAAGGSSTTGYEVEITYDDPNCCRSTNFPTMSLTQVSSPVFYVPFGSWRCFSWRVRAICPGGYSNWVSGGCNCSGLIISPTSRQGSSDGENGNDQGTGSEISVEAIPNPATEYIDFSVFGMEKLQGQTVEISIHDITGREVARKPVNVDGKVKFDVYSLAAGLYIYKVNSKEQILQSGKIMIDKK